MELWEVGLMDLAECQIIIKAGFKNDTISMCHLLVACLLRRPLQGISLGAAADWRAVNSCEEVYEAELFY